VRSFAPFQRVPGSLVAVIVFAFLAVGVASIPAQDVQVTDVSTDNREVTLFWNPVPGDTMTQAERLDVPFLSYGVPIGLGVVPSRYGTADPVVGQGAGRLVGGNQYEIYVGVPGDFRMQTDPSPSLPDVPFDLAGGFQFGPSQVGVAFTGAVDPTQATQISNYTFVPALNLTGAVLQANGSTVILQVSDVLPDLTDFTGQVSGVTSAGGDSPVGNGSFSFQSVAGPVTALASIQGNPNAYLGQQVTVVGQVYEPTGTSPGASRGNASGYIQDASNRGINLWGGGNLPAVDDVGNVVAVTGTGAMTGTTVQITSYTPTVIASGIPRLGAESIYLPNALSSRWEGTFIRVEGLISRVDADSREGEFVFIATVLDTAFGGYQVWRAQSNDPAPRDFRLLRTYSLVDSTWTFTGTERSFADPDSIIPRGTERDRDEVRLAGPFNGFDYTYSVTWFETVINATVFPYRFSTIPETVPSDPGGQVQVVPNKQAVENTPLLAKVSVVPNPYNPDAPFSQGAFPSGPGVQFVNLPATATISIYTIAGDLVNTLEKPNDAGTDALFWNLTNGSGKEISAGIYLYYVTAGSENKIGKFVIIR